jgi:hypothetical protein
VTFVDVEQSEYLECRDKGGCIASIRLGEREGRWFFALGHQQRGGDCWGAGGPLGFSPGGPSADRHYPDRDAALTAAIIHARERWAGREREMAPQFAWLDTLHTEQPDLFRGSDQ